MGRGRPRKVYDEDPVRDAEFHKLHSSWDFTDFDISDERLAAWKHLKYKTLIIAEEICPKTGKLHWQGRITFRRNFRFPQIKKILGDQIHLEPTTCCVDDNYCRKLDSRCIIDHDTRHQGSRNIFKDQMEAVKNGANLRECSQLEGSNYQSIRSCHLLMEYFEPERPTAPREVHLVASAECAPTLVYRLNDMRFWNGYDADTDIYINQAVCKLTLPQLKMVCGAAPFRVGRGRQAKFDHVYISGLTADERKALDLLSTGRRRPEYLLMR